MPFVRENAQAYAGGANPPGSRPVTLSELGRGDGRLCASQHGCDLPTTGLAGNGTELLERVADSPGGPRSGSGMSRKNARSELTLSMDEALEAPWRKLEHIASGDEIVKAQSRDDYEDA